MSDEKMDDDVVDDPIVEAALDQGLISDRQYDEALDIQRTVAQIGITQTLPDILVKKGYLTSEQVRMLGQGREIRRIGKYELVEKLGSGGAGVVYRARHAVMGRIVALKVLSEARAQDASYLDRFKREARVAVTLNHKNIVRGIDYGEADGFHYFVMEFVPGETLLHVIQREGRIDERLAFEYGAQVASALAHAGQFNLVHRDLKPENLLVSAHAGEVKVCDLGLAKPTALTEELDEAAGSTIGTPSYISPEQIRGKDDTDSRSDIYSLGATLYHAVTGEPPFVADSVGALLKKHLREPVRDPRETVVELSSGATAVLMKMLAKDRTQRYQSLRELMADLEAVRDGRPPVHTIAFAQKQVSSGRSRSEIARSRSKPRLIVGVVVGLLALGVAAALLVLRGGDDDAAGADESTITAGGDPAGRNGGGSGSFEPTEEEKAELDYKRARRFWEDHPESFERAIEAAEIVARNFDGTMGAVKAKALRDEIRERRRDEADRVWTSIETQIDRAIRRRRYADAMSYVERFPDPLRAAEGYADRPETRRREIEQEANDAWAAAMETADEATAALELDRATAALEPFEKTGLPEIDAECKKALADIADRRRELSTTRAAEAEAFASLYGQVFVAFGLEGYDAAFALLDEGAKVEELAGATDRVSSLNDDLNRASAFTEAIREGFGRERGQTVEIDRADGKTQRGQIVNAGATGLVLRERSKTTTIPWNEVEIRERVRRGLAVRGEMTVTARVDAALWLLGHGHLRRAAEQIKVARTLGEVPAGWDERASHVETALGVRVDRRLREARAARLENDGTRALRILDELTRMAPDHGPMRLERGRIMRQLRRTDEAIHDLKLAVADPDVSPLARYELGKALLDADRRLEALESFEAFLATDPAGDEASDAKQIVASLRAIAASERAKELRAQGEDAVEAEDWDTAIAAFEEALALAPDDEKIALGLAESYEQASRFLEAYVTYRRCVRLRSFGRSATTSRKAMEELEARYADPPEVRDPFERGLVALKDGAYAAAIEELDRVIGRAPLKARAYYNRAIAYYSISLQTGEKPAAQRGVEDFERYLQLDPLSSRGVTGLAKCWYQLDEHEKALAEAKRAIGRNETDFEAHYIAGLARLRLDEPKPALVNLSKAIELEPRRARLYITRARIQMELADWKAARDDLDRAETCGPNAGERNEITTLRVTVETRLEGG